MSQQFGIAGSVPQRLSFIDWLSVSQRVQRDEEINDLIEAVESLIRSHFGYGESKPMKRPGNFGEGRKYTRVGGFIRWTKYTMAALNDWDEEGRCVGWVNLVLTGQDGIGSLHIDRACSLLLSLESLGFLVARRIDLTIDVVDHEDLTVLGMRDRLQYGDWKIPRRDPACYRYMGAVCPVEGKQQPATLYLSSKSSDNLVRVYDKSGQLGLERPHIRFELESTGQHARTVYQELLKVSEKAFAAGSVTADLDTFITSAVRASADIRDVTGFPDRSQLPTNWARSPLSPMPEILSPVFQAVAPLYLAETRLHGGFAAQIRHASKSSGKAIWKVCIIQTAQGKDPGAVAFALGLEHHRRITEEDFIEMAQQTGLEQEVLEQAELDAITNGCRALGMDVVALDSDKTLLRKDLRKALAPGL